MFEPTVIGFGSVFLIYAGLPRQFAGFSQVSGHVRDFEVEVLRCATQYVEGVGSGEMLPLHKNSFGLADDVMWTMTPSSTHTSGKSARSADPDGRDRTINSGDSGPCSPGHDRVVT